LAQSLELAKLKRDAFFDVESLIRHGHILPAWSGVALGFSVAQFCYKLPTIFTILHQPEGLLPPHCDFCL
jgi:hypothetical protein